MNETDGQNGPPPDSNGSGKAEADATEPVWTFRGYRLRSSEFTTAMVHFFRAEVTRSNVWRQRLDSTTNWAVITTGAVLSFAFTEEAPHLVILINVVLVTFFLFVESRRYRYYELWSYRVRLMETDFFAPMLVPPFHPSADWAEALAENLLHPQFAVSGWEALGRRLRRNYLWIYTVVWLAWATKLWIQPTPATSLGEFIARASIGNLPGQFVLVCVLIFVAVILVISIFTVGLQESSGEVLPRYTGIPEALMSSLIQARETGEGPRAWFRHSRRRRQLLTFIITDQAEAVTKRLLKDLGRGVTSLSGTGMYTGERHGVLMCALTVTEVPQLKAVVADEDPNAFVIVSPAQEVFGRGFVPLEEEEAE